MTIQISDWPTRINEQERSPGRGGVRYAATFGGTGALRLIFRDTDDHIRAERSPKD